MDGVDKPTDPKEVELTEVDKKTPPEKNNKAQQQLIINVQITFCTHVGWDGVLVMLFTLKQILLVLQHPERRRVQAAC